MHILTGTAYSLYRVVNEDIHLKSGKMFVSVGSSNLTCHFGHSWWSTYALSESKNGLATDQKAFIVFFFKEEYF